MRALSLTLPPLAVSLLFGSTAPLFVTAGVRAQEISPVGGNLAGPGDPTASPDESSESKTKQSEAGEDNVTRSEPQLPLGPAGPVEGHNKDSLQKVQLRLDTAKREQAEYSTVLPWLTLSLGAAGAFAALLGGAIHTIGCEGHCDTAPWIAFTAVAGGSLATLGVIWTMHAEADVRELDSQRYQLEQELERVRLSRVSRELMPTRTGSTLSFRFAL